MGFYRADAGVIHLDGAPVSIESPQDARNFGLGMVFQHFTLIPSMTVAENLVLARPGLPMVIDWKAETARLKEFLERAPFRVSLQARVESLSAGQKQKVEILKELYLQTRLLILDEPTSVLTLEEADEVFLFIRRLVDKKQLSVILITHKFREVTAYCDEVTVLRRGRFAGSGKTAALDPERMAEMMMGEPRAQEGHTKAVTVPGKLFFRIENLSARGDNGLMAIHGVNLSIRSGEIRGSLASRAMARKNLWK